MARRAKYSTARPAGKTPPGAPSANNGAIAEEADDGGLWYGRFHEIMHLDARAPAYGDMTRTGRFDDAALGRTAPTLAAAANGD